MKVLKPIFIFAPARSGTSILYSLFTRHKKTAFFEHFSDKYYSNPWKFSLIPLMVKQQMVRYKIRPEPHEGAVWRKYYPYGTHLDESDITEEAKNYIYSAIKSQLKAFQATRFVNKTIDLCIRLKFLNAMFPDAYFIYISRDPKAVVHSQYQLMKKDWDDEHMKKYPQGYRGWISIKEIYGNDVSMLETCINYYKHYIDILKKDLPIIQDKTVEVKYEEFIKHPHEELKRLYEFVELAWYNELENIIPKVLHTRNNEKWLQLPDDEKKILENAFKL